MRDDEDNYYDSLKSVALPTTFYLMELCNLCISFFWVIF